MPLFKFFKLAEARRGQLKLGYVWWMLHASGRTEPLWLFLPVDAILKGLQELAVVWSQILYAAIISCVCVCIFIYNMCIYVYTCMHAYIHAYRKIVW